MKIVKKVAFAGCGGITGAWMNALKKRNDIKIVGLCDLSTQAMDQFEKLHGITVVCKSTNLQKMIAKSGAEIIFDCTIPAAHKEVVTKALEAGCHVLGEKPMAESMDDARTMVQTAAASGKRYAVIQNRRYDPNIILTRKLLNQDEIGKIHTLNADFFIGPHFDGFRTQMDHVLLGDMAIHSFDQARYLLGADAVSVYAEDWNPASSWYRDGANAVAIFHMSNGTVFTYRGSWCAEGCSTTWECDWRITGNKGTVLWDGTEGLSGEKVVGDSGFFRETEKLILPEKDSEQLTSHAGVIDDFITSLDQGTRVQTECTDNIKSLAMVLAAIKSCETGKRETIHI